LTLWLLPFAFKFKFKFTKGIIDDESLDSASVSPPHMSESDTMNTVVSDITTVKVTKYTGDKELYNKYQRILYKFSGFL
jgi:hypothetical protein